jgi:predicted nucleic acid-binding protein
VLELLLQSRLAGRVHERLQAEPRLHVPHLIDLEVLQVLRRFVQRGEMSAERAEQSLALFRGFPFERYPHHLFATRIWALRNSVTAYDAAYIALAESLDAPLLTCDARLASAAGHAARCEVIG